VEGVSSENQKVTCRRRTFKPWRTYTCANGDLGTVLRAC